MQIVVRYAKHDKTGRECIRTSTLSIPRKHPIDWTYAAAVANKGREQGERIVQISEGGYH